MSPKKFGPKKGGSYVDTAKLRWGTPLPDWIEALAVAADAAPSQTTLNARLKFQAPSVISGVLNKTYPGKLDRIEAVVRGALMAQVVRCPVLGSIGRDVCVESQKRKFTSASPTTARLWSACRNGCPNALSDAVKEGAR